MATHAIAIQAASPQDMETMTMQYIAQGYTIANKTAAQVSLIKRKKISTTWIIIDLVCILLIGFGLIMLLITMIVYAADNDKMVTITVAGAGVAPTTSAPAWPQTGTGPMPQ